MWYRKYVEKLDAGETGASLPFGTAVDRAIEHVLEGHKKNTPIDKLTKEAYKIFEDNFSAQEQFGKLTVVFDNDEIAYSHNDFDAILLKDEDYLKLEEWQRELGLPVGNVVEMYKEASKDKKNFYKKISPAMLKYFNRASWLSLYRKGPILIQSFMEQFYPKIRKVHSAQTAANIKDAESGNTIQGFIDMIVELEGYDKPIIIDLKTATRAYKQEQLELSDQLTLYAAMKGYEYNTNLVGYVVLIKSIPKDTEAYCNKCNTKREGRHKTCNEVYDGDRCHGTWNETTVLKPEVQVMVTEKSISQMEALLEDHANIIYAMENKIVYKDLSKCHNMYGNICPFFDVCHNNDYSGVRHRYKK